MNLNYKKKYQQLPSIIRKNLNKVKLLVFDFDGTFTDNSVYTDASGNEYLMCSKTDSMGLNYLSKYTKVVPIILSKERNQNVQARAKKLNIEVYLAVDEKKIAIEKICKKYAVSLEEIAYIGNDYNDIPVFELLKMTFCVQDGIGISIDKATVRLNCNGGKGAVREVIEYILLAKNVHPYYL